LSSDDSKKYPHIHYFDHYIKDNEWLFVNLLFYIPNEFQKVLCIRKLHFPSLQLNFFDKAIQNPVNPGKYRQNFQQDLLLQAHLHFQFTGKEMLKMVPFFV